jgi:DNA-directed RNA polymerase subunit M/transcription elongation factor TFIIS
MEVKTVAVQIRCPYCKQVLYIKEEEFDIETKCSHCNRAFIWSNILEQERWKKENLKRWQESERQKEQMRKLEEVRKSGELQPPEHKPEPGGGAAPVRFRLGLLGTLVVIAAVAALVAIIALTLLKKS